MTDEGRWVRRVELTPPRLEDNRGDADRLLAGLRHALGTGEVGLDPRLLPRLPDLLRRSGWKPRCALFLDRGRWHLLDVLDPDRAATACGVAVDLGTTRIALRLVDLETGAALGDRSLDNPQREVGPDILTRVHFAAREGGLERLRSLAVEGVNEGVAALCADAGLEVRDVRLLAVAGNTTMAHLLAGLDPRWIIREPYIPVTNSPGLLRASDLGIAAAPTAGVYVFPNIGSYFGGDLLAGILFSGMSRADGPAILVDVGTNAEVVLGGRDWLLACAGAAGPALESGVASIGMVADDGVIDRVRVDRRTRELALGTIGGAPPKGICGSGLIDLAAELFLAGMIDLRGKLVPAACGPLLARDEDGAERLVLVPADRSATGEELAIDQAGLDSLTKAKAAMYTILETVAASVGLELGTLVAFHVAGAFGSVIDPASAIAIGMLPDLPLERFRVLGNSSLGGATRLLESAAHVEEVESLRDRITYLELNVNQDFMNRFNAAQFYPHTRPELFPSVKPWGPR